MKFKNSYSKYLQWLSDNIAVLLILVFYSSEGVSKIFFFTTTDYSLFPRAIKLFVLGYISFYLFRIKDYNFFKGVLTIIGCYAIGQFFIDSSYSSNSMIILGRFLFPIILFRFFIKKQLNISQKERLFLVFETLLLLNSILIVFGLLFDVYIFETYRGERFGYNGLLLTSATSSYVYIIALYYYILKYKSSTKLDIKMIIIVLSSFLIGTKSIYLAITALLFYIIFIQFSSKIYRVITLISMLFLSGLVFFIMFYQLDIFNSIREEKGLLSAILSYRNDLLIQDLIPYIKNNWNFVNYLFGGVSDFTTQSEMGFIDVFYYWGILGGMLYLIIYYKSFITFKLNSTLLFFLAILFLAVFLSGNFFFYSTIPIYLIVFRERIHVYLNKKN